MKERNLLVQKSLEIKHSFLQQRDKEGATAQQWGDLLLTKLKELMAVAPSHSALVLEIAKGVWEKKSRPKNARQLELLFEGFLLPYIIRFNREELVNGVWKFVTVSVLAEVATVAQLGGDVELKKENEREVTEARKQAQRIFEIAEARAGGDPLRRLIDLIDGKEDVG